MSWSDRCSPWADQLAAVASSRRLRLIALVALLLALPLSSVPADAAQVDVLWWDGEEQFGEAQRVQIHPFAGGDKHSALGDTQGDGLGTWELRISNYSRTWDVSNQPVGARKQADLFVSFSVEGISAHVVSVRYDSEGGDVLDVVTLREYNVNANTSVDFGLGPHPGCQPANNCLHEEVVGANLSGLGKAEVATESTPSSAGWIYRFGSLELAGGPSTKDPTQVGTIRIGSILFELNDPLGSTSVQIGAFNDPGSLDSIVGNDNVVTIPQSGPPAVVVSQGQSQSQSGSGGPILGGGPAPQQQSSGGGSASPSTGADLYRSQQQAAIAWLLNHQNPDGSWGPTEAAAVQVTAAVLEAFYDTRNFDNSIWSSHPDNLAQLRSAESFLMSQRPQLTRDLIGMTSALARSDFTYVYALDELLQEIDNRSNLLDTTEAAETPDRWRGIEHETPYDEEGQPGWGFAPGHQTNTIDTAMALRAARLTQLRYGASLWPGTSYADLVDAPQAFLEDQGYAEAEILIGGPPGTPVTVGWWGFDPPLPRGELQGIQPNSTPPLETSEVDATAIALETLQLIHGTYDPQSEIGQKLFAAGLWLVFERQNQDGGIGAFGVSTLKETARTYLGWSPNFGVGDTELENAIAYLVGEQSFSDPLDDDFGSWGWFPDGEYEPDPLRTALALRALAVREWKISVYARDTDGDGYADASDDDIDNDGILNAQDSFPMDATRWLDLDGDGIADQDDPDDDGDGFCDPGLAPVANVCVATDLFGLNPNAHADTDGDQDPDSSDGDIDGDSEGNWTDDFVMDGTASKDTDGDGTPDPLDQDDDNDGIVDVRDPCPVGTKDCNWTTVQLKTVNEGGNVHSPVVNGMIVVYISSEPSSPGLLVFNGFTGETTEVTGGYSGTILSPSLSEQGVLWGQNDAPGASAAEALYYWATDTPSVEVFNHLDQSRGLALSWSLSKGRSFLVNAETALYPGHVENGIGPLWDVSTSGTIASPTLAAIDELTQTALWLSGTALKIRQGGSTQNLANPAGAFALDRVPAVTSPPWVWCTPGAPYECTTSAGPILAFGGQIQEVALWNGTAAFVVHDGGDNEVFLYDFAADSLAQLTDNVVSDRHVAVSDQWVTWLQQDHACSMLAQPTANCLEHSGQLVAHELATESEYQLTNHWIRTWTSSTRPILARDLVVWEVNDGISGGSSVVLATLGIDGDHDLVVDRDDNCLEHQNPDQCDLDADGYGSACDADYNQDIITGGPDFGTFRAWFSQTPTALPELAVDNTCDGGVGGPDFATFRALFTEAAGPSGLACASAVALSCPPEGLPAE